MRPTLVYLVLSLVMTLAVFGLIAFRRGVGTPAIAEGETPIATGRIPGIDVARALAVLGMILVNFKGHTEAEAGPEWLLWLCDRLEGRAAALFVLLAGVGISLRSRRARKDPATHLAYERRALFKRAAVLLVAGYLNLHMWEEDILHFYGVFLLIAAPLLNARRSLLVSLSALCVVGHVFLDTRLDYNLELSFYTPRGAAYDLFFNGLHPVFPWVAFLLFGMLLGRTNLGDPRARRRWLFWALPVAILAEIVDAKAVREAFGVSVDTAHWISTWPRSPAPGYVIAAGATAIAFLIVCIELTEKRAKTDAVVMLTATGQLAFTLYILHAIAIIIPMQHDLFTEHSLAAVLCYAFVVYFGLVAMSVWWRRRHREGPLEGLIRQITGRNTPAPWGGGLA